MTFFNPTSPLSTRKASAPGAGSLSVRILLGRLALWLAGGVIDARRPEPFLDERIDREHRQVSFIEHHRISECDRPLVVPRVIQQVEQRARPGARLMETVAHRRAVEADGRNYGHLC